MKITTSFGWFSFIILVVSCKMGTTENLLDLELSHTVDTISIEISEFQLSDYAYSSVLKTDSENYFYGYNSALHRIDKFSINDQKFLESIPLNMDGPDAVESPFDFFIQSSDSIFYYGTDYSLNLLGHDGVVKKRNILPLTNGFGGASNRQVGYISHPIKFKLHYDTESNSVFFHSYSMESASNRVEYYQVPILAEFHLTTGEIDKYPFYFPDSYLQEGAYFGEYIDPNIVISDSLIIFSFPNSPVINVYDREQKKLKSKRVESQFTRNKVASMPPQNYSEIHLRFNHLIENPYFYTTVFDPYRKLFYRVHRGEHPNPDLNLGNVDFSYTRDYLTVMDQDLNVLEEMELPTHKYNALSFFVTKEGLHFPFSHYLNEEVNEDKLVFHVYDFQLN